MNTRNNQIGKFVVDSIDRFEEIYQSVEFCQ